MRFKREIKVLEARQRLEALVIPKRQALTRLQLLLATQRVRCAMLLASDFQAAQHRVSPGCLGIYLCVVYFYNAFNNTL